MKKIFIIILLLLATNSFADDKTNLFKNYIENLNSMSSNFIQFDKNNGTMSEGIFYIQKPDKVKFEYTNPFRTLLIANGKIVTYYDIDLDEISTIPAKNTPIAIFMNLNFDNIKIKKTKTNKQNTIFETEMSIGDDIYYVSYIFNKDITELLALNFKNTSNEELDIEFFDTELNPKLDKKTFTFKNPRLYKRR